MARPTISFSRVAKVYDRTRGLPPQLSRRVGEVLGRRLRSGRTLEVGVGTGRVSESLFADEAYGLVGVDVAKAMLERARRKGARRLALADARALPFRDKVFDRAMSTHLLHLIVDWPKALQEISRVTRVEYLTVLEHEIEKPDLSEEYGRRALEAGYSTDPPGLSERKLPKRLPPDTTLPAGRSRYVRPADEMLQEIARRSFRAQWVVPPPVHRQIVRELERSYAGQEIAISVRVQVSTWSIRRLAAFAARAA